MGLMELMPLRVVGLDHVLLVDDSCILDANALIDHDERP